MAAQTTTLNKQESHEWEALILAGTRGEKMDPVAAAAGVPLKAFARIGDRSMASHVLDTLIQSHAFAAVRISLPPDVDIHENCPDLAQAISNERLQRATATANSPAASVEAVLNTLPKNRRLLVATADHPLLDMGTVSEFIAGSSSRNADATCGLVSHQSVAEAFPESKRTPLRFREGTYVGCNLFALAANEGGRSVVRFWRGLEAKRKQPIRMAAVLGVGTLVRYRMGMLGLDEMINKLGEKAGANLAAIELTKPTAGIDVDSPEDLSLVSRILDQSESEQ